MRRWVVVALAAGGLAGAGAGQGWAQPDDEEDEEEEDDRDRDRDRDRDDDEDEDRDRDRGDEEEDEDRRRSSDDDEDGGDGGDDEGGGGGGGGDEGEDAFERNSDHTRPGGGRADQNSFQRIRFFVDKEESAKTAKGTLYQGSLTSSNFVYRESGGTLTGVAAATGVGSNSQFMRMFTDLRAQLDALHIGGTRWDFRFDGRARVMNNPSASTESPLGFDYPTRVQGGLFGKNEFELREMWFVRGGDRADIFVGRQFISDLGALKIDGIRVDYASSEQLTFIGFGGLYPFRGSRSITTDYIRGRDDAGELVGRVIPFTAGGGAAYRTERTYGSFGGVAIVPLKGEQPRVYVTGNGYWRIGPKLDLYHFGLVDLYGAAGAALTNLSVGINARPVPRIRATASIHRVDTETLNITAQAFLNEPVTNIISNETLVQRIASDQVRGGLSVSLGDLQQIELSTSLTYRRRPAFTLTDGMALEQDFPASSSVEALFQAVHRSLFKQVRVGLDVSRIFKVGGGAAYARTASISGRLFASREFDGGKGEWEAEVAYTQAKDQNTDLTCGLNEIETCYGSSAINLLELGGAMYYRLRDDVFLVGLANLGRYNLAYRPLGMGAESDPPVTSISAFLRLAYRF